MSIAPDNPMEPGSAEHTILVVDDEPAILRLVSDYLKNVGFRILVSRDGESALERARYAHPDLILLDVVMPGLDGFETCRRLKADETLRDIPVIFMTSLSETQDKVLGFQLGAVDYIPKPFEYEEILGRITTHLRLRDLARELRAAKENLERQVEERTAELARSNEELRAIAIENAHLFEAEREQRRQVEQSHAQLVQSEKLAATGRLAASLAHEINNPLQIIHNSLQLLLTLPFGPDKQQEYLQMASEEVERLVELVTRILDFARPSRRKKQPADVNDAVEKALNLTAKYLQHNDITLHRDLALDLPPVAAVADELGQVFLNLVLNAVDAMPHGGTLHVSSRLGDDGHLVVAFTDSGPGITPEHLAQIFEPFFSTKEGGTGLGLSISYDVVERHGGDIVVESVVGKGTTFTVRLPAMAREARA